MYRYHKNVGFPTNLRKRKGTVELYYTEHALYEAAHDRLGQVHWLPSKVRLDRMEMVECDADADGNIYKAVYRLGYKPYMRLMLVLVILFHDDTGEFEQPIVKSVWLNSRLDRHYTLQEGKYDRPVR